MQQPTTRRFSFNAPVVGTGLTVTGQVRCPPREPEVYTTTCTTARAWHLPAAATSGMSHPPVHRSPLRLTSPSSTTSQVRWSSTRCATAVGSRRSSRTPVVPSTRCPGRTLRSNRQITARPTIATMSRTVRFTSSSRPRTIRGSARTITTGATRPITPSGSCSGTITMTPGMTRWGPWDGIRAGPTSRTIPSPTMNTPAAWACRAPGTT